MKKDKTNEEEDEDTCTKNCTHCGGDIHIRNPKGFCDHLYYPENCDTCKQKDNTISYVRKCDR